jgi:hypothetical protein
MREREEEPLTPGELELGEALARLRPAATAIDPIRIRWEAQRRRAARQIWWWRGIAAALALALSLSLLFRPQPKTIQRLVYLSPSPAEAHSVVPTIDHRAAQEPLALPATAVLEGGDYLAVRDRVLAFGVRVLPPPPPAPSQVLAQQPTEAAPARDETGRTLLDWFNPLPHEGRS